MSLDAEEKVRRRILSIYHKTEADFDNVNDWYNYEEDREQISTSNESRISSHILPRSIRLPSLPPSPCPGPYTLLTPPCPRPCRLPCPPIPIHHARLVVENLVENKRVPETEAQILKYQADHRGDDLRKHLHLLQATQKTIPVPSDPPLHPPGTIHPPPTADPPVVSVDAFEAYLAAIPASERRARERKAGGWDEEAAWTRLETEFLSGLG